MPFGSMFGALFFGVVCPWLGVSLLLSGPSSDRVAGGCLAVLGLSVAAALLARWPWARWGGIAAAALVALAVVASVGAATTTARMVTLLGALATAVLIAVPATGRALSPSGGAGRLPFVARLLAGAAVASCAGLAAAAWLAPAEAVAVDPAARASLPAQAFARRPVWTDYGSALERARGEGAPLLLTFVTSWCPYCTKMERTTWKAAPVLDRLRGVVAVRIDAEEGAGANGQSGAALAARHQVRGFPTLVLLSPEGRTLARADGYLSPAQFVEWFDGAMGRAAGGRSQPIPLRTAADTF